MSRCRLTLKHAFFFSWCRSSVLSPPPPPVPKDGEDSDLEDNSCTSLMMSINLSMLSRVPIPPLRPPRPSKTEIGVFTHRVGSFTSRGAQVERGLIIDSDVSTTIVVELSEFVALTKMGTGLCTCTVEFEVIGHTV